MINEVITVVSIIGTVGSLKKDNFIIKYICNKYKNYKNRKNYINEDALINSNQQHNNDIDSSYEELSKTIIIQEINKKLINKE